MASSRQQRDDNSTEQVKGGTEVDNATTQNGKHDQSPEIPSTLWPFSFQSNMNPFNGSNKLNQPVVSDKNDRDIALKNNQPQNKSAFYNPLSKWWGPSTLQPEPQSTSVPLNKTKPGAYKELTKLGANAALISSLTPSAFDDKQAINEVKVLIHDTKTSKSIDTETTNHDTMQNDAEADKNKLSLIDTEASTMTDNETKMLQSKTIQVSTDRKLLDDTANITPILLAESEYPKQTAKAKISILRETAVLNEIHEMISAEQPTLSTKASTNREKPISESDISATSDGTKSIFASEKKFREITSKTPDTKPERSGIGTKTLTPSNMIVQAIVPKIKPYKKTANIVSSVSDIPPSLSTAQTIKKTDVPWTTTERIVSEGSDSASRTSVTRSLDTQELIKGLAEGHLTFNSSLDVYKRKYGSQRNNPNPNSTRVINSIDKDKCQNQVASLASSFLTPKCVGQEATSRSNKVSNGNLLSSNGASGVLPSLHEISKEISKAQDARRISVDVVDKKIVQNSSNIASINSRHPRGDERNVQSIQHVSTEPHTALVQNASNIASVISKELMGGEKSIEPKPNDVLIVKTFGGNPLNDRIKNHPGNLYFQKLCSSKIKEYFGKIDLHKRSSRRMVVYRIIDVIESREPPGRFLKSDRLSGPFLRLNEEEACNHVWQVFCSLRPILRRHSIGSWGKEPSGKAKAKDSLITTKNGKPSAKAKVFKSSTITTNNDSCLRPTLRFQSTASWGKELSSKVKAKDSLITTNNCTLSAKAKGSTITRNKDSSSAKSKAKAKGSSTSSNNIDSLAMTKTKTNDSTVFPKVSTRTPKYVTKNEKYLRELASFNAPPEADEDAAYQKPPKRQRKQVRIFVPDEPTTVSNEAKAHVVGTVSNGTRKRKREVVADSPSTRTHKSQRDPTSPATSPETKTARKSRTLPAQRARTSRNERERIKREAEERQAELKRKRKEAKREKRNRKRLSRNATRRLATNALAGFLSRNQSSFDSQSTDIDAVES